jgi:hypothetical protein
MIPGLTCLSSDDFQTVFGLISSAEGLYGALRRSPQVAEVRAFLTTGRLDDDQLRSFVAELLEAWSPNHLFPHDIALAALAVVLESRFTGFADEYLLDLARLRSPQIPKATRIAQLCLAARTASAHTKIRRFVVGKSVDPDPGWRQCKPTREENTAESKRRFQLEEAYARTRVLPSL